MPQQKLDEKKNTPRYCKGATVEPLKQAFMDCQISCTSPLPWIWVIETLACSNQVDISLLLDLLEKTPEISHDLGRNARELVSLRILESFFSRGACENSVSSFLSQKIRLDPSDNCEDVLLRILTETSPSHLKPAGPEMWKWDLQPFIELKRSSYGKYALRQLKDAILTGSHSFFASLKDQSGLSVGNQHEHVNPIDDGNCNGIAPVLEGSHTNGSFVLHRDVPHENLILVNRKRKSTIENKGGNSCENQILSENGKTHIESVKKFKLDVTCSEEYLGEKLKSSGVDRQLAGTGTSTASMQGNEGERCSLGRKTHVADMGPDGPFKDDNNECAASKGPD
ncbi:hypothetical protein CDL12_10030 [Handroanthus impetiginosus]|uniref:Uncharacterized protein n=1 Tax=Handroanthus impetiginosus TaxID=429701 RepID=A0A2G9HIE4_9LAMI|nr:hypothetical protein CDL12_10030 [Handroanthus impetiginosus]